MPNRDVSAASVADFEAHVEKFEAMHYDGTLASYWRIIEWAKSKGDTTALAKEWIFRTRIITFPSYDAKFKAAGPGDWIVWNGKGFHVWSEVAS